MAQLDAHRHHQRSYPKEAGSHHEPGTSFMLVHRPHRRGAAARPPATAVLRHLVRLPLLLVALTFACSLRGELDLPPAPNGPPLANPPSLAASAVDHKILVRLSIEDMASEPVVALVGQKFDAFLYGHPLNHEDQVAALRAQGLEAWRDFNVFHYDLRSPRWGNYHLALHDVLKTIDGWIPGVHYRWFGSPLGPDLIIDHTRLEVTDALTDLIEVWADSIGAEQIYLDVVKDSLEDWMLWPGDSWPWDPRGMRNAFWRRNTQIMVGRLAARWPTAINGSHKIAAPFVMYENQHWNHRRGHHSWRELVERVMRDGVVPLLHVGHDHLETREMRRGEAMAVATWLLFDHSYLVVDPERRALDWALEVVDQGLRRFEPAGPAEAMSPGVWRRAGWIDGRAWEVVVDTPRAIGVVRPAP